MPVYLPIAEMSVNAGVMILLGVVVGFFSGLFGVGGGFLTTPFLMFFGIPPFVAVATQTCQITASSATGCISQWQRRRIDVKIGSHMVLGGFAGAIVGLGVFQLLRFIGQIDLTISVLYTLLLGTIGCTMLFEIARSFIAQRNKQAPKTGPHRMHLWLKTLPYQTDYAASELRISILGPIGIGFASGMLISIMGTGVSFLVIPAMIYFLGMPALMVTGTALFQLFFLSALSCIMHSVTAPSVDMMLALLLISGSVVGAILGLRATKYIRGLPARLLLAVLIVAIAVRMGYALVIPPIDAYSIAIDH